jgi:hypothetical protein
VSYCLSITNAVLTGERQMTRAQAETDMLEGYLDGLRGEPLPGFNRSASYRHGYANGRDDRHSSPRAPTSYIHSEALAAISQDTGTDYRGLS